VQLTVESTVLDCGCDLPCYRRQQPEIFAVERLVGFLAAQRQHRDGATLEHARHKVVDTGIPPRFDFLREKPRRRDRIVERHGVAAVESRHHRRTPRQRRHRQHETIGADRGEVARRIVTRLSRRKHQRHPIDDERFDDPRDQTLAEPDDVEVAVQIARKGDQRAPVVVAVAVERSIESILHGLFDRPREQHDYKCCQRGDDPVVIVDVADEHEPGQLAERRVERDAGGEECGVGEPALDDHLDVTQTVTDDRACEGQRHHRQQHRGQLQLNRWVDAKHPGQRISTAERTDPERGAPGDPAQLAAAGDRGNLPERAGEYGDSRGAIDEKVDRLGAIEHFEDA
jgi:hypothetical protein